MADRPADVVTITERPIEHATLVLGSTQDAAVVDAEAAARLGVEVTRRRSGGGAVLLEPAGSLWVDVEVPRLNRQWDADVGRSFLWLGRAWAEALAAVEVGVGADVAVHDGRPISSNWSRLVCFAGLGSGEVSIGGVKVLGMAQRRTRDGATFGCLLYARWEPDRLLAVLALDDDARGRAERELAGVAGGVGEPALGAVVAAFELAVADSASVEPTDRR